MTTESTTKPEPTDLTVPSGQRKLVVIGLLLGLFFSSLDQTVVGTAMPTIIGELGHIELLTWITTAYLLSSTSVVPIAGKLADLFGRRSIYLIGMIIFMIGSALCGVADSMTKLAIFRGIQGIGGGMLMPLAMTIIGDITTGETRAKFQGMFMAVFGLSSVFGPQLGGWMVDYWNWHWIFYINLPFGVLAALFIASGLKGTHVPKKVVIDWAGIITLIISIVSLLLALSFGGKDYAWGSWQIITLFATTAVFMIIFTFVERRAVDPVISMNLFKDRTFNVINAVGFLMSLGMFGAMTFIPLFMQGVIGMSASKAASVMTPMMLGMIVTSILGARLLFKIGLRNMLMIGLAIMVGGFLLYLTLDLEATRTQATIDMIVMGLGMGLIMPSLGIAVQELYPAEIRGTVTSATTFFRQIGGTVGIALLGAVFNHKSVSEIGDKLDTILGQLGPQGGKLLDMAHNSPAGLYSSLLNANFLSQLPKPVQDLFTQQVTPILKTSLLDSLHTVFFAALWFCVAGFVVAIFTGKVKITGAGRQGRAGRPGAKEQATSDATPQQS